MYKIQGSTSAWWSSRMIPPLGVNSHPIGGGPGFNSRSGPFFRLRHCLTFPAACTAVITPDFVSCPTASLTVIDYVLPVARAAAG